MTRDVLPEHHEYLDTGCSVAPRCLACPLPECWMVEQRPPPRNVDRNIMIIEMRAAGRSIEAIAAVVGKSKRTVLRILAAARQ